MARFRPSLVLSLGILAAAAASFAVLRRQSDRDFTGVAEAIDGDSLRLAGQEIRLKGIDAPELSQTCAVSGRISPCGRDARAALRRILGTGLATCVGGEHDRYGRLLAVCRVRGVDVNAWMVREGQAISYGGGYEREERDAKARYAGIWAGEFERPSDWRARHPRPQS